MQKTNKTHNGRLKKIPTNNVYELDMKVKFSRIPAQYDGR